MQNIMSTPQVSASVANKNSLPVQIRAVTNVDDQKFVDVLERVEQTLLSCISTSKTGVSLSAQIVYLQDVRGPNRIVLPVETAPAILFREGRSYVTNSRMEDHSADMLRNQLESLLKTAEPGRMTKEDKVTEFGFNQQESRLPADFVIYVPSSDCHVKVMIIGTPPSSAMDVTRFTYSKENVPLWYVDLTSGDEKQVWVSLCESTLAAQYSRMQAGQSHGVTLLVRDFLRNAIAVAKSLNTTEKSKDSKLFFPGVFDLAADVKQHYNEKVGRFVSQEHSEAGGIRKYNNLIKSVLLNHFVSGGSGTARSGPVILDLACGHGQDLMKYKNKYPKFYLGLDISQEALNEARRRYKSSNNIKYPADFMQGNLMLPETFTEIRQRAQAYGITDEAPFDIVSMQLALHYIVGSENDARNFFSQIFALLKPGGRFIATFPCCNRIARRLRDLKFIPDDTNFDELYFGNDTYRVTFKSDEICRIVPKLEPVISQHSEEVLDKELEEIDFEQVATDLGETWGAQYKFYLVQTIDNQEEYVVPNLALEQMFKEMKVDTEMTANFAEVIAHYAENESPVIRDFKKHNPSLELNPDEDEVFRFYRAIVVRKD